METSTFKSNCFWSDDFDPKHMEYSKIGLTTESPKEFLLQAGSKPSADGRKTPE